MHLKLKHILSGEGEVDIEGECDNEGEGAVYVSAVVECTIQCNGIGAMFPTLQEVE